MRRHCPQIPRHPLNSSKVKVMPTRCSGWFLVMMISQEQTIGGGDLHVRRETLLYGGLTGMQRNLWVYQSFRTSVFDTFRQVIPVEFMSMEQHIQESVYVINCIWELFVLVGKNARGHRKTIRWAVELSKVTHTPLLLFCGSNPQLLFPEIIISNCLRKALRTNCARLDSTITIADRPSIRCT